MKLPFEEISLPSSNLPKIDLSEIKIQAEKELREKREMIAPFKDQLDKIYSNYIWIDRTLTAIEKAGIPDKIKWAWYDLIINQNKTIVVLREKRQFSKRD